MDLRSFGGPLGLFFDRVAESVIHVMNKGAFFTRFVDQSLEMI